MFRCLWHTPVVSPEYKAWFKVCFQENNLNMPTNFNFVQYWEHLGWSENNKINDHL